MFAVPPSGGPAHAASGRPASAEPKPPGGGTTKDALTVTGQVLGTPNYMPPEQASSNRGAVGTYSDIYSLGAILYHLLTGRPPFQAKSLEETLLGLLNTEPVPPRALNSCIARDLETICLKCLNKEPARRYSSARALAEDLGHWLAGEPVQARPASQAERLWRWCRRNPSVAGLAATASAILVIGFVGILYEWRRAEKHAVRESQQRVRAEEVVARLEMKRAEEALAANEVVQGLTTLARVLRAHPTNLVAAHRLISALSYRSFAVPVFEPLQHDDYVWSAEFSPDGRWVATASRDGTARVWDARSGLPATPPLPHSAGVIGARFSADSRQLVTCSHDMTARVWDALTGQPASPPLRHGARVNSASFSADGSWVVTASDDQTARVWSTRTGQPDANPLKHNGPVAFAQFSPDGQSVVTASDDGTARLWNARSGQPLVPLFQHKNRVNEARFSPNGQWIATASDDWTARVWNAHTGQPVTPPMQHQDRIYSVSWSLDGGRLVTASHDRTARLWDAQNGRPLGKSLPHDAEIVSAEFSIDGLRVVTASKDATARVWDARTGESLTELMTHQNNVYSARFSPDGQHVVTASEDRTARVWDIRIGRALPLSVTHPKPILNARFSPDGQRIVTASRDHTAQIWSSANGQPQTPPLTHGGIVRCAEFSPDGQRVVTSSDDNTARVWDVVTGRPLTEPLRHRDAVLYAEFSPDGLRIVTASLDGTARVWSARTGEALLDPFQHPDYVAMARFSPDGRWIVTASRDDCARTWDARTGRLVGRPMQHGGWVGCAEFSPDGLRIVTASGDKTARVWDAATGQPLTPSLQHQIGVHWAHFSRDGLRVATGAWDRSARIWDAQTGRPLTEPLKHGDFVNSVQFSPDGEWLVTGSRDKTARLWNARTGQPLTEPFLHNDTVWSARFSPDGRRVVTASEDASARIWETPQVELPIPAWLPDLVEAVVGHRVNNEGNLEAVPVTSLIELRRQRESDISTNAFSRWAAWLFADRTTRTISPSSSITIPAYVERNIQQGLTEGLREALLIQPTNGLVLARLAQQMMPDVQTDEPRTVYAAWATRRAVELAPDHSEVWLIRGEFLMKLRLFIEAERALLKSVALQRPESTPAERQLFVRDQFIRAADSNLLTHGIPPRDSAARAEQIDLSLHYTTPLDWRRTEDDLDALPRGVQTLAGTTFDLRGLIQLSCLKFKEWVGGPKQAEREIRVRQTCRRLHFLHSTGWSMPEGTRVGSYLVRYSNGDRTDIPLMYGENIREWVTQTDTRRDLNQAVEAWTSPSKEGGLIRIFKFTWENPRPESAIETVDFESAMTDCSPFLIAITAEP